MSPHPVFAKITSAERISLLLLFAGLAGLLLVSPAAAQTRDLGNTRFQLGDKVIIIPAPDGFEEAASQFEQVNSQMSATEDPSNEMLAVHLPKEDCERLRHGEFGGFKFYTKVSVRRAVRGSDYSEQQFASLVSEFRKNGDSVLDINSPRLKAAVERLDKSLSEISNSDTKLEMSQPIPLGEMDTRPNVYSVLLSINYVYEDKGQRRQSPILGGLTFIRLNQRLIYVYTYRRYNAKADIEIIQDFTKKWITKILAAN